MKLLISNQFFGPLKENQKSVCRGGSATGGNRKKREKKKIVSGLETERVPVPFIDDFERVAARH